MYLNNYGRIFFNIFDGEFCIFYLFLDPETRKDEIRAQMTVISSNTCITFEEDTSSNKDYSLKITNADS